MSEIDDIDRKIIAALQADGKVTVNELALVSTSSMVKIKAPVVVLGRID